MTGPIYTVPFSAVAVSVAQDLFQLLAQAVVPIIVRRVVIGHSSDAGDSAAEMLDITLNSSDMTINGSGGTTVTPVPHSGGFAAAVTIAEANNTTVSTVLTEIFADAFNVQAGFLYLPTPEELVTIAPTEGFIVKIPSAPDDELTMSGHITFEELR